MDKSEIKYTRGENDWIQTYTGAMVYPMDPQPDDIHIEDIAHSLAMSTRYCGHCSKFYSVAEHSVYVSQMVSPQHMRQALLHDASEAYISDIARPIKPFLSNYKEIEEGLLKAICNKFEVSFPLHEEVKIADSTILHDEMLQLMKKPPGDWGLPYPPAGIEIRGYDWRTAKAFFMERFYQLWPNVAQPLSLSTNYKVA